MKKIQLLSEVQIRAVENAVNLLNPSAPPFVINHVLDLYLLDEEVMLRMKFCRKSFYNYRQDGYLSWIPFHGRNYTYLPTLLAELLALTRKNEMKPRKKKK